MKDTVVKRARAPVREFACPRGCGWKRRWTDSKEWMDRVIEHPIYGNVNGGTLLAIDINRHNCGFYLDALRRLKAAQNGTAEAYRG